MSTIKDAYHRNLTLVEAEKLTLKVLKQVMEERITTENVELVLVRAGTNKLEFRTAE